MIINKKAINELKQKLNLESDIDILAVRGSEANSYTILIDDIILEQQNESTSSMNDVFIVTVEDSVIAFKGSTFPNKNYLDGNERVNQLMNGFYTHYSKGIHNKGTNTEHSALRQTRNQPVLRTFNKETNSFDISGIVDYCNAHDNIHAGWCKDSNQAYYESKGCQVIMGYPQCPKRKKMEGQWKTFISVIESIDKQLFNYLVIPYRWFNLQNDLCIFGSRGEKVEFLQRLLGISQDGIFGKDTLFAVIDFQKKNNLTVDGVAGNNTFEMLKMKTGIRK